MDLVPFGSVIFTLSEPSIKFIVSDITLALAFTNIKLKKYLEIRVWVVTQFVRHTPSLFILK